MDTAEQETSLTIEGGEEETTLPNAEEKRLLQNENGGGSGAEEQEANARLKLLYPEVDEEKTPLPHCWSQPNSNKHHAIGLEDHGRRVHFEGERGKKLSRSVLAQCNIPDSCGIFYYENTILSKTGSTSIAVGLATSTFNLNKLVNIF